MKKLYSYSESFRGGCIEGLFVSTDEELKRLYGKDLYYGECLGKHSELTLRFEEGDFTVQTEDQAFIEKFEELIGYTGYYPFDYIQQQWIVQYSIGDITAKEYFDYEEEAEERYAELEEDAEGRDDVSIEIYQGEQ